MTQRKLTLLLACVLATSSAAAPPSAQDAKKFIDQVNTDLRDLSVRASVAEWIKNTYITDDTEENAAWANEAVMGYLSRTIRESTKFSAVKSDPDTARMLMLLRLASSLPAPSDAKKRQELASLAAKLEGMYGKGKWCGPDGKAKCRDLQELTELMSKERDYNVLLDAWSGWHTISRDMRPLYSQLISHTNEGAKEIGFADTGSLWRSGYEMPPEDFQKEMDRLWDQLRPMYEELHCYVRAKLSKHYGAQKVSPTGPIPAHLLGNMWAQEWANIYPLVEPYKGQANNNLDSALKGKGYDAIKMVKLGEGFFTSLGFPPLPETFWKKSMFTQPRDRDVVCHASAWDVHANADLRIKMCTKVNTEDLVTIHHELGHIFYYQQYYKLPYLYQSGANDGFHEAIGDALTLSITPDYSQKVGLRAAATPNEKGLISRWRMPWRRSLSCRLVFWWTVGAGTSSPARRPRTSTTKAGGSCGANTKAWSLRSRARSKISILAPNTMCPRTSRTLATSSRGFFSSNSIERCVRRPDTRGRFTPVPSMETRKRARS
jgi:peptidyl-dipeptidase A